MCFTEEFFPKMGTAPNASLAGLTEVRRTLAALSSPPKENRVPTANAKSMRRGAQRMFGIFNRDKNLSPADRRHLKAVYMQRMMGREEFQPIQASGVCSAIEKLGGRLFTAEEVELLTGIDKKTIYNYATAGTIPHVRIESNVRFWEREIVQWLEQHSHRPRWMRRARNFRKSIKKLRRSRRRR